MCRVEDKLIALALLTQISIPPNVEENEGEDQIDMPPDFEMDDFSPPNDDNRSSFGP